jgi:hypothetical protein
MLASPRVRKGKNILGTIPRTLIGSYVGMVAGSFISAYVILGDTGFGTEFLSIIFFPFVALSIQIPLLFLLWFIENRGNSSFQSPNKDIVISSFFAGFTTSEMFDLMYASKILEGNIIAGGSLLIVIFVTLYFLVFTFLQNAHSKHIRLFFPIGIISALIFSSLAILYFLAYPSIEVMCGSVHAGDSRQIAEQTAKTIETKWIDAPQVSGFGTDRLEIYDDGTSCDIEFKNNTVLNSSFYVTYL